MTKILDWRKTEDPRDVIHMAVQALAEGHLVAFPNDGHYIVAASGLRNQAIERLSNLVDEYQRFPLIPRASLMLRSVDELLDYCPSASKVAIRVGQRCWPGPIDLVLNDNHAGSLVTSLPDGTKELVANEVGELGFCSPRHESFLQVGRLTAGPLILAQALRPSTGSNYTASDVKDKNPKYLDNSYLATDSSHISSQIAFVIDSGTIERIGQSTLVRVKESRCEIIREGLMTAENLSTTTSFTILLVCTGNTCRSPMAEAILRSKLSERLEQHSARDTLGEPKGDKPDDSLMNCDSRTFRVISAGVAAQPGGPASEGALLAMKERGLNLDEHQSRSISEALLERCDLILTMTSNHRQAILSRWPQLGSKIFELAPEGSEVSDPYGGPLESYRKCADRIDKYLDAWIDKLDTKLFPTWYKNV